MYSIAKKITLRRYKIKSQGNFQPHLRQQQLQHFSPYRNSKYCSSQKESWSAAAQWSTKAAKKLTRIYLRVYTLILNFFFAGQVLYQFMPAHFWQPFELRFNMKLMEAAIYRLYFGQFLIVELRIKTCALNSTLQPPAILTLNRT